MKIDILKGLWVGFGLLFVSFILSIFIIALNTGSIEREENVESIGVSAYEMEINVVGTGLGVMMYLESGEPQHRLRVENDAADFQRYLTRYRELAVTDRDKELSRQVGLIFGEYESIAEVLMDTKDHQRLLLVQIGENVARIDEIIDEKIQQNIDRSERDGAFKVQEAANIEADAAEVSTWLGNYLLNPRQEYRDRVSDNAEDLREHISQFRKLHLTAENRQQIEALETNFGRLMASMNAALALNDSIQEDEKRFIALRTELDQILDDRIQNANEQILGTVKKEVDDSLWYLRILSRIILVLGIGISAVAAWIIVKRSHELKVSNHELQNRIDEREEAERQLSTSKEQLRALSAHLQTIREEERTRISREVHDDLGQLLAAMAIDLSWIERNLSATNGSVPKDSLMKKVRSVIDLTEMTSETVRRIATELRDGLLDDFGLVAAIERQTQDFEERTGIECDLVMNLNGTELDQAFASAGYHIFQEAMTNIALHANASVVSIVVEEDGGHFVLQIEDNGIGVTAEELTSTNSLGVVGMRERAVMLGGEVEIKSVNGKGTRVTARIPIPTPAARVESFASVRSRR
jgi:signal transduction histidine kinase